MTLTVIALLFVPVMQLFSNSLFSTSENLNRITAMNLAQSEMERTINLNLTKDQLLKMGDLLIPLHDQPPIEMNNTKWRILRDISEDTDPVEVRIQVFREGEPDKIMVTLVTLIEDTMWDQVTQVAAT